MTLYAADVMDLAKPVETKKSRGKKKAELPTPPASEPEVKVEEPVAKPKREMSEKQKAALEKAKETRKRKREEALAAKQAEEEAIKVKQEEIAAKEAEIAAKKEAVKEKRRLAREAKKNATVDEQIDKEVAKVTKKPRVTKSSSEPPQWFQKYVEGVKKEQARHDKEKKPVKQIQEEASQVAQSKWDDGLVRDRLRNEVDGHMNRMYSMIFSGRNLR